MSMASIDAGKRRKQVNQPNGVVNRALMEKPVVALRKLSVIGAKSAAETGEWSRAF
jgi:hypothetical protein